MRALAEHQVVIVCGETGSGKTTQLPKIALAMGRGRLNGGGLIGHTQPRRIAASSVAKRIAEELKTPLGDVVGYKVRFQDRLSRDASVKLMTDGILLAETQSDPLLKAYDTLIIDEAHERSLNIDFLLGYLRELLPRRPDLKIIVTSATIDADRFAKHFESARGPAPVLMVSGRLFLAVTRELWTWSLRGSPPLAYGRLAQVPVIRLVGNDPMRQAIDELAQRLGLPEAGGGIQVQTSQLALELVRRGMGWTVVDFLTAQRLDPRTMVAIELHELPPMSLYSYHSPNHPPGQAVQRMLAMLPGLLQQTLSAPAVGALAAPQQTVAS